METQTRLLSEINQRCLANASVSGLATETSEILRLLLDLLHHNPCGHGRLPTSLSSSQSGHRTGFKPKPKPRSLVPPHPPPPLQPSLQPGRSEPDPVLMAEAEEADAWAVGVGQRP
eukprot:superscaffoldBa00000505_g5285